MTPDAVVVEAAPPGPKQQDGSADDKRIKAGNGTVDREAGREVEAASPRKEAPKHWRGAESREKPRSSEEELDRKSGLE